MTRIVILMTTILKYVK